MDEINERVEEAFPEGLVTFEAFELDEDGLPVDNLDDVAIEGKCILVRDNDPFYGEGKNYQSGVLDSPTWWSVLKHANEMVLVTGDEHHVFLEALTATGTEVGGVRCFCFQMGS